MAPRTAGAGDQQVSVEDIPITNTVRAERLYIVLIIDPCRRLMLYVLAFIGVMSAGCIAGLPSTTCYALADAYTTTLQLISQFIMFPLFIYVLLAMVDIMIKEEKAAAYKLLSSKWKTIVSIVLVILFTSIFLICPVNISEQGLKSVRLAINHCFVYATEHEQNLRDKIPLAASPVGSGDTRSGLGR